MTPAQQKLAIRLYQRYQTNGSEYRKLAESMGITTGELNAKCWRILAAKRGAVCVGVNNREGDR